MGSIFRTYSPAAPAPCKDLSSPGKTDYLILTASYGNGHLRASQALRAALLSVEPKAKVEIVDFFSLVHPTFNAAIRYVYVQSVKKIPYLYGHFYRATGNIPPSSPLQRQMNQIGWRDLQEILHLKKPKVIICTYPTPAGVLSSMKAQGYPIPKTVTIITDYVVHSQWVHPHTDLYLVAIQEMAENLRHRGIPADRIRVTGIPVDPTLAKHKDAEIIRRHYGFLPDRPTILLMGGAYGMGAISRVARTLSEFPRPLQLLVVCGYDRRLYQSLQPLAGNTPNPLRLFGYTNEISSLMAISDLLITKAGGLTVSEALTAGLPMVIYRPIPGQEEENTRILLRQGAALSVNTPQQLEATLSRLLQDPATLQALGRQAKAVSRPRAALDAARALIEDQ